MKETLKVNCYASRNVCASVTWQYVNIHERLSQILVWRGNESWACNISLKYDRTLCGVCNLTGISNNNGEQRDWKVMNKFFRLSFALFGLTMLGGLDDNDCWIIKSVSRTYNCELVLNQIFMRIFISFLDRNFKVKLNLYDHIWTSILN